VLTLTEYEAFLKWVDEQTDAQAPKVNFLKYQYRELGGLPKDSPRDLIEEIEFTCSYLAPWSVALNLFRTYAAQLEAQFWEEKPKDCL
jgi:hypothetical protein